MGRQKRYEEKDVMEIKENEIVPAEVEENGFQKSKTGVIANSQYVNLRKEPSLDAPIEKVLNSGDKVNVLGEIDGFYKVQLIDNLIFGFVSVDYLEIKEE